MDKKTGQIINAYKKEIEAQGIRVQKVVLFGSRAGKSWREDSDIDIAIISKGFKGKGLLQRIAILTKALTKVFEPIEALAYTPDEWRKAISPICRIAKETGISVAA